MPTFTLGELARRLGAKLEGGDQASLINSLAPLHDAGPGQLTFLGDAKYASQLATTKAEVVLLSAEHVSDCPTAALVVENPKLAFAALASEFARETKLAVGVHATAIIGDDFEFDNTVAVGARVVIGDRVTIGANTKIFPGVVIGDDVTVGENSIVYPNVTIYGRSSIGSNVILHAGCVIGSDGFGNVSSNGLWSRMPQLGRTIIGNNVDIGANTTIDCGALGDTVIADGVKIDNLVQIAHNVVVNENTAMAAQVGIAGSTTIGKNCILAGKVGVAGHIKITDKVVITAMSGVTKPLKESGVYSATFPAMPARYWLKVLSVFKKLIKLSQRVKSLERLVGVSDNEVK